MAPNEELSELRRVTSVLYDLRSTMIILVVLNVFVLVATFSAPKRRPPSDP